VNQGDRTPVNGALSIVATLDLKLLGGLLRIPHFGNERENNCPSAM
jgi:hypothetical protein